MSGFDAHWEREKHEWTKRGVELSKGTAETFWNLALEEAALEVDRCNREGPYQAIGAADLIRCLKSPQPKWIQSDIAEKRKS